jgi:hypothetical protein
MARQSLQEQINVGVRDALASMGFALPGQGSQNVQTDGVEFGSDEHRQFLGLVVVDENDDPTGYTVYKSRETGITYRLEDEIGVVSLYPGVDPDKAAVIVLRQKINELEAGPPPIPANAPSLWQPVDKYTVPVSV